MGTSSSFVVESCATTCARVGSACDTSYYQSLVWHNVDNDPTMISIFEGAWDYANCNSDGQCSKQGLSFTCTYSPGETFYPFYWSGEGVCFYPPWNGAVPGFFAADICTRTFTASNWGQFCPCTDTLSVITSAPTESPTEAVASVNHEELRAAKLQEKTLSKMEKLLQLLKKGNTKNLRDGKSGDGKKGN